MTNLPVIPVGSWPRLMRAEVAAEYCKELSAGAFLAKVGFRYPSPNTIGGENRWFKEDLDEALTSDRMRTGFIYFVAADGLPFVKIGYAVNPDARLAILQVANPFHLYHLAKFPGVVRDESCLHRALSKHLERGEWYRLSEEVVTLLRDLQGHYRSTEPEKFSITEFLQSWEWGFK